MAVGMQQLTEVQKRILQAMPSTGAILLRPLAMKLDMSSNEVRIQVRKLEALGYLSVGSQRWPTEPLKIRLIVLIENTRPNFDKLLISTRWV